MNKQPPRRLFVGCELVFVFGLLIAQIWFVPRSFIPLTAVVILGFIWASRRHCPEDLTWSEYVGLGKWEAWTLRLDWKQTKSVAAFTLISLLGMIAAAFLINPAFWQEPKLMDKAFERFSKYLLWGPAQQFLLQGYVTNRIEIVCKKRWLTAFVAGSLFAMAHYPNPVLMPGTFILGAFGAYFFLKGRNVFLIGLSHAVLATAVRYLIAYDFLDHPMRVGPGFWN